MTGLWQLRATVLTLLGAMGLHEGRYLLAPPTYGHEVAAAHTYLPWLTAGLGALAFVLACQLAARLATQDDERLRLPRWRALWLGSSAVLLGVFLTQELVELAIAHGHFGELVPALTGAWLTVPLALGAGAVIALLLKGAAAVADWVLARTAPRRRRPVAVLRRPQFVALTPRGSELARRLAGRAPPLSS